MRVRINRASQLLHNSPSGLMDKALALSICPIWNVLQQSGAAEACWAHNQRSMDRNHPLLRDFNFYACLSPPKRGNVNSVGVKTYCHLAFIQKALSDFFKGHLNERQN